MRSAYTAAITPRVCTSVLFIDPVLLSSVDVTRPVLRRFELGMSEFVGSDAFEDENRDPTTGKPRRLSLSLQKRPREHDSETVKAKKPRKALQASNKITESEYERMAVHFVPSNTKKNNDWARNNFIAWRDARNGFSGVSSPRTPFSHRRFSSSLSIKLACFTDAPTPSFRSMKTRLCECYICHRL